MSKVTETLVGAREILSDPVRWTQGFQARDSAGRRTAFDQPEAVCFCLMGAINRAAMNIDLNDRVPAYEAMDMLDKVIGGPIHALWTKRRGDHTPPYTSSDLLDRTT